MSREKNGALAVFTSPVGREFSMVRVICVGSYWYCYSVCRPCPDGRV